jgi:glycosyltransferase involved in cell wall biosynthesis
LLKRLVISLLWLPDDEQRFIWPAYRAGKAALQRGGDLIYTTAPSFSTHLAGLLLRRTTGVRWVAEFRDPWILDPEHGGQRQHSVALVTRCNRALERWCIRAADAVVTVTDRARALYQARLGGARADKVFVARNGIAALEPRRSASRSGPFRIVYSGSIYGDRDPRPFLNALAIVAREEGLGSADIAVDLYVGATRFVDSVSLESWVEDLGIAYLVRFLDWLPHVKLMATPRDTHLLLRLAQRQPVQVPNKLYEYLATRVRILAFVDEGGESAHMLREVGDHFVLTSDEVAPIVVALRRALATRGTPSGGSEEVLEAWLTERQMQRLLVAIGA